MTDLSTVKCPDCSAPLTHHPGCRTWCPVCDWNVGAPDSRPTRLVDRVYRTLGEKAGRHLFISLIHAPDSVMRPQVTPAISAANALAGFVHLVTVALAALGAWLIWAEWSNWFFTVAGALLVLSAWLLFPKPLPEPKYILTRELAPTLFASVDRVADALETPTIDTICVASDFNAYYGRYGWRRRSLLILGVPLWLSLDPQEKVALIAHELGHQVSRDFARGLWIGAAISALVSWISFLRQPSFNFGYIALAGLLVHYALYVVSIPVYGTYLLLIHLHWRESQRAEYLADYLGSRVSGTEAYIALNTVLLMGGAHANLLEQGVLRHSSDPAKIIPAFAKRLRSLPPLERERVRREAACELTTLDATHPPIHFRSEMVCARPCAARVTLSEIEAQRTDREVSSFNERLGWELLNRDRE